MTLPRIAQRIDLVALRVVPLDPPELDGWGREKPAPPQAVATWRGDLQPRKVRGGSGEVLTSTGQGAAISEYIVLAPMGVDVATGDVIRREPDDELRYSVSRVDPVGEGLRLAHLEISADLVTTGVPEDAEGS